MRNEGLSVALGSISPANQLGVYFFGFRRNENLVGRQAEFQR